MKTSLFLLPLAALALAGPLGAQTASEAVAQADTDNHTVVLQDADYLVRYDGTTLDVTWRGAPAGGQLVTVDEERAVLYNEAGEARLLLFTRDDFRYYDREYANPSWFDYALEAMLDGDRVGELATDTATRTSRRNTRWTDADDTEIVFDNGLVFRLINGVPFAELGGEPLEVTGSRGRYRVITPEFEAGVALGRDEQTYRYLRLADTQ